MYFYRVHTDTKCHKCYCRIERKTYVSKDVTFWESHSYFGSSPIASSRERESCSLEDSIAKDFMVLPIEVEVELPSSTAGSEGESNNPVRPEITQVYSRRPRSAAIDDSHVQSPTPPAAPETESFTSQPPSVPADLNIPIALRKESKTCKSNYRIFSNLTSHSVCDNCSTSHYISNHVSFESVSSIQGLHCISTIG